jgi:hypothetical protein
MMTLPDASLSRLLASGGIFSHRALPVGLDEMAIIAVRNAFEVVLMLHGTAPKT